MKMRKIVSLALAMTMMASLVACGGQTSETKEESGNSSSEKSSYKIGLSWPVMDAGQTALSDLIISDLEEKDPNAEIFLTSADGNNEKQLSDVEDLIAKGCDIIYIMAADAEAMAPAVDKVHEAGIICGIARNVNSENYDFMYVSAPDKLPGEIQGQWMVDYINEHPDEEFKIAHVSGTSTNSGAVGRRDGFYETVMDAGLDNVEWVVEQDCNYITETAQACVEGWLLSHPEINVLACANDDMAIGAANACKAAGRDDIMILGIDGQDTGLGMIRDGSMAMSVRMNVEYVGIGAADAIYGVLTDSVEIPEDKIIYGDVDRIYEAVDASNVADYE